MKLAIEKLSPLPGSAILWNNLHVVLRTTLLTASFGYILGTLLGILDFDFPTWSIFIAFLVGFLAQFRITAPIAVGISLRRLRYNGTMVYARMPLNEPHEPERPWITDIPERFLSTAQWLEEIKPKIDVTLEAVEDSVDRVMFFIGRDETEGFAVKVYHACDSVACEDFSKHFRNYEEARDGVVHWGGL